MLEIGLILKGLVIGSSLIIGVVAARYFGNDNKIEEVAEHIIQEEVGIDIDLSPMSPETENKSQSKSE